MKKNFYLWMLLVSVTISMASCASHGVRHLGHAGTHTQVPHGYLRDVRLAGPLL